MVQTYGTCEPLVAIMPALRQTYGTCEPLVAIIPALRLEPAFLWKQRHKNMFLSFPLFNVCVLR